MVSGLDLGENLCGGGGFAEARKDVVDAVPMVVGVGVGHRVDGKHHVVTVLVGGAGGGLHTQAGGDSGDHDLGDAALLQLLMQVGAPED